MRIKKRHNFKESDDDTYKEKTLNEPMMTRIKERTCKEADDDATHETDDETNRSKPQVRDVVD